MASAYKNVGVLVGSTGDVTVYTCPTATEAVVKNINLYNSHSGAITVYTKINDSSACFVFQFMLTRPPYPMQSLLCKKLNKITAGFVL